MATHWDKQDRYIPHTDEEDIREVLMGRKVESVSIFDHEIVLDDGTVLEIAPNNGSLHSEFGNYFLEDLNTTDNIITKVEFGESLRYPTGSTWADTEKRYTIFVYADSQKINLLEVDGDDGDGNYGTGYEICVRTPSGNE